MSVITDPKLIELYRLKVIRVGLKLEMDGRFRLSHKSCYALAIKEMPGIEVRMQVEMPGRKSKERMQYVLDRFEEHIQELEAQAGIKDDRGLPR